MKKGIVVLGSTNTDMVITGRRIPVPGETVSGGTFKMNPGGKGANQAVAVARLSTKRGACTFVYREGGRRPFWTRYCTAHEGGGCLRPSRS